MRILFDQGTPEPLRRSLTQYEVATAYECGWARLKNGELLDAAEKEGFAILVTTDSNLRYQQNLHARRIAIVVLTSTPPSRADSKLGHMSGERKAWLRLLERDEIAQLRQRIEAKGGNADADI